MWPLSDDGVFLAGAGEDGQPTTGTSAGQCDWLGENLIDPTLPGVEWNNPQARFTIEASEHRGDPDLYHQRDHDESADRTGGVVAEQAMVGSASAGGERHGGRGLLL